MSMDKLIQRLDAFTRLSEQTAQPLRPADSIIDYSQESLVSAYTNILVLTELNSLLQQVTDEHYNRDQDEILQRLEACRAKFKFPKY